MATLVQDLRYAARGLARNPGFTAAAVVTLALGIGVNTAIVSLIDAVLLRPVPGVARPERLAWIVQTEGGRTGRIAYPDASDYRGRAEMFDGVAAVDQLSAHATIDGASERVEAQIAGGDYFAILGVVPAAGRFFTADDDRARRPLAVLSGAFWRRRFGADPGVVGKTIAINGRSWTIAGVASPSFLGLDIDVTPDVFLPVETWAEASGHAGELLSREAVRYRAIARLRAGVPVERATAAVSAVAAANARLRRADRGRVDASVEPMQGWVPPGHLDQILPTAALGFVASGLVVLIACANVANLLLARAASRGPEMRIRRAIGASRGRIVRQLLTESVLLAGLGAAAGGLLAAWGLDLFLPRLDLPPTLVPAMDLRVLGYSLAVAVITGVLFGLAPAWSAAGSREAASLHAREASAPTRRLQGVLVAAQLALSLVLLAAAGLFLRSLDKAAAAPAGFDRARAENVATLSFDLAAQGFSAERSRAFCADLIAALSADPSVRVAVAQTLPLGGRAVGGYYWPDGGSPERADVIFFNAVSPAYFETLGIRTLAGRAFRAADRAGSPRVAIVNETLARRYWPGASPIGKRLLTDKRAPEPIEIVGVVPDGKYMSLTEEPQPYAYFPILQVREGFESVSLFAWQPAGPSPILRMREAVRSLDPALPTDESGTLADVLRRSLSDRRQGTLLVAAFGILALVLAAVGLSGVVAYAVARRRREIGVRLALGATRRDVVALFVRQGSRLAAAGLATGMVLTAALTRLLSRFLFGVTPLDVTALVAVSALLGTVALIATAVPARRAASTNPVEALRQD
ncbi:MAG TPA: ABC transporter permease [Thermoanaerobaculia bacterium]|nr:ABC transporter permease [Thermoanaerobaculia bacterium]